MSGYVEPDGTWVHSEGIGAMGTPQTGVTDAGQTAAVEVGAAATARLTLTVTAASGTTPSLTVAVQTSRTGTGGWATVASFAAATGSGAQHKAFGPLDRYVRAQWDTEGTDAAFDFALTGTLL
jgi:hypothetical protein